MQDKAKSIAVKMESENLGLNHNRQYQNKDNTLISKDKREKVHLPLSPPVTKKRPIRVSFFMPVCQPLAALHFAGFALTFPLLQGESKLTKKP